MMYLEILIKEGKVMDYKKNKNIIIQECNTALEKVNIDDVNTLVQIILEAKMYFYWDR